MPNQKTNIVLIGMPGAGKSTVGIVLAKQTARDFVDTDVLIQTSRQCSLQDIMDGDGYQALRQIEEQVLLGINVQNHVIATGGSAAYSEVGMHHLKAYGRVVFLEVELATLRQRIHDFDTRGIAKRPEQTFADLFEERFQLYTRYADVTVACAGLSQEGVCIRILDALDGCP